MLTKKYSNGFVTLDATKFSPVTQETIDREVRNFEPVKVAIEKLYECEQKDIPMKIIIDEESGLSHCPNCGDSKYILFGDKLCIECGQALDWSSVKWAKNIKVSRVAAIIKNCYRNTQIKHCWKLFEWQWRAN